MIEARFENAKALLIAGLGAYYTRQTRSNIPQHWQRLASGLGQIPGRVGLTTYGVSWNQSRDCEFEYLAGVEVDDVKSLPAYFDHVCIPQGRYAVFAHREHVASIVETFDAIWNLWLPSSQFRVAKAPCFERYDQRFDPQTGTGGFEIWLPLEA